MSDKDTIAALQRNLAAAEVERLWLVAEVERLTKALDICSSVHAHNVKLHEERKRLTKALRDVAERQREACALEASEVCCFRNGMDADEVGVRDACVEAVRATPLVTEEKP